MSQQQSDQALIHRLPLELLPDIFLEAVRYYPHNTYYTHLLRLGGVCRCWRQIIHSTPELWSIISYNYNLALIEKAFVASRNAPIDVVFDLGGVIGAKHGLGPVQMFQSVLEKTPSRWRSASFDVPLRGWMLEIINTLEQASALLHLHLNLRDPSHATYFEGESPIYFKTLAHLHTLSVSMGLISFPPSALSGLLSLRLIQTLSSRGHPSYEWLAMLAACPCLVELELTGELSPLEDESPVFESKIELGSLITMILCCGTPLVALILGSLSTPNCQILDITISLALEWSDYPEADFYGVLAPHVAAHARRVIQASREEIVIVSKPGILCMRSSVKETSTTLYLGVNVLSNYEVASGPLLMLKEVFGESSLPPHSITITLVEDSTQLSNYGLNLWRDEVFQCISLWPGIYTICYSLAQKSSIEDILYFLAQPSYPAGLPCPNLRELIFNSEIPRRMADAFARFILDRHANQILQREEVARLENIQVSGRFGSTRDAAAPLKAALEETGVSWQEGVEMDERRSGLDLLQFTLHLHLQS